jgi:DUF971 family protein
MKSNYPKHIKMHRNSNTLELVYSTDRYYLSAEYLRTHSPSAEVRGHGPGQATLQHGKLKVTLRHIDLVGRYAVKLTFSDGHDSGLYSWNYLFDLCIHQQKYWKKYLSDLNQAGKSRDPDVSAVQFVP